MFGKLGGRVKGERGLGSEGVPCTNSQVRDMALRETPSCIQYWRRKLRVSLKLRILFRERPRDPGSVDLHSLMASAMMMMPRAVTIRFNIS